MPHHSKQKKLMQQEQEIPSLRCFSSMVLNVEIRFELGIIVAKRAEAISEECSTHSQV